MVQLDTRHDKHMSATDALLAAATAASAKLGERIGAVSMVPPRKHPKVDPQGLCTIRGRRGTGYFFVPVSEKKRG